MTLRDTRTILLGATLDIYRYFNNFLFAFHFASQIGAFRSTRNYKIQIKLLDQLLIYNTTNCLDSRRVLYEVTFDLFLFESQ